MADDDEIDILGDFHLDDLLIKTNSSSFGGSNSEILNCDYTIHPQWLLDKPSANPDNWYNNNTNGDCSSKIQNDAESESIGHVSTENSITDESGWTEKEKSLLHRGIEIFGKSNVRLSQFVGSRTASEVKYYLKNFYSDSTQPGFSEQEFTNISSTSTSISTDTVCDIVPDTQIPASIEEIIAVVSTGKPTVVSSSKNTRHSENNSSPKRNKNLLNSKRSYTPKNDITSKLSKFNNRNMNKHKTVKNSKYKFKTNIKLPMKLCRKNAFQLERKMENGSKNETKILNKIEITTGKGLSVPICEGEEIIKISKESLDEDSDLEIEIDVENEDNKLVTKTTTKKKINKPENIREPPTYHNVNTEETIIIPKVDTFKNFDFSDLKSETMEQLTSVNKPDKEFTINETDNTITELEKVLVPEFFEGSITKTPSRYLKIRNHIMSIWKGSSSTYVTKTFARQGLHNCGDVNCISKVHSCLEQIGAINFGCNQVNYIRPLYKLVQNVGAKEKLQPVMKVQKRNPTELGPRSRNKKKFNNDGEGGCTLMHDETGEVINTTIINEDPVIKQKVYVKKPLTRLILCKHFPNNTPQEFKVKMQLSALLLMDFHSHCSVTEVMGLIAGHWRPDEKLLTITHYEPCKNIASSETHCDMCPVSQAKAAEIIHNQGFDILGWFHSHPTFAPEPSHQDLETQLILQQWIGHQNPCIGVILSPFIPNKTYGASPFRCLVVENHTNDTECTLVPYKIDVDLITDGFNCDLFLSDAWKIFNADYFDKKSKIDFRKPYIQDGSLTNLDKLSSSIKMNILKSNYGEDVLPAIAKGIYNICCFESSS